MHASREAKLWEAFVAICAVASPVGIVIAMHVLELFGPWGAVSIGGLTLIEFLAGVLFAEYLAPYLDRK